jgi:hypothetical protein
MLDILNAATLTEEDWRQLSLRAELPISWEEYSSTGGVSLETTGSTRKHCRIALRSIAIVFDGEQKYAAYAKDVSKGGIGFYSPVQLLPRAIVRLWIPGRSLFRLRVTRCRRLDHRSYECGSVYESITQAPTRRNA